MEGLIALVVGCVAIYLLWKLTKALMTVVLATITLGVLFYFAAPYVLNEEQLTQVKSVTERGEAALDRQLNKAKKLTEDGVVKPLQNSIKIQPKSGPERGR